MKTVGTILKDARCAKGITLQQVEEATKIRQKFLRSIEADDLQSLPSLAYAKGFVKNYGEYLGLSAENVLAFFRRQTQDVSKSSILPVGMANPMNASLFQLTPGKFLTIVAVCLVGSFLVYLGIQYRDLQRPPALVVDSPYDKIISVEQRVDVVGRTDSDATVTVNGVGVLVRSDGKFFDQIPLSPGENTIVIVATSRHGKNTTVERKAIYQPQ
ncbi:helix-turn-helix domain-containing protein [Patescibacteria group bacterium]|nr:helix-turn-helix domain-containing protein [Patescibacteria group bacterium]MBU1472350.1 helix-turn-helix domain-containing protein [Patescibacteria group bacterium]MBU2460398.1 helix-turn-helix domain-containing protein [Patescibacteria group bacterium]MBU2544221.1 helix-turn-helix domain-containing protein [Patescibacteria group bacterium]